MNLRKLGTLRFVVMLFCLIAACVPQAATNLPSQVSTSPTMLAAASSTAGNNPSPTSAPPLEIPVQILPLGGEVAKAQAEVSAMGWYGDYLLLVPQFPERVSKHPDGALFAIPKETLIQYIEGQRQEPLTPIEIPLVTNNVDRVNGFEGFEAVTTKGNQIILAIEASPGRDMKSYLVSGEIEPDLGEIRLDAETLTEVPMDNQISNLSNEALALDGDRLLVFFEANGASVYKDAQAMIYDLTLQKVGSLDLDNLEFRLTDATPTDEEGYFWVINFFFPGDLHLLPSRDPIAEQFGQGPTHAVSSVVERLVKMQVTETGVVLSGEPPIQIQLADGQVPRNWEGIAELEGYGFLLITDKFPETLLGFVPYPAQ